MKSKKKIYKRLKKIAIKKIRTKLYTKNKWKKTFVFYQGERKKINRHHTVGPPLKHSPPQARS
jgi:hypothetical protein